MTTNERWLLLSPSEDGNPVSWLKPEQLAELLADPGGSYGIDRFVTPDDVRRDPNYWPSDVGILLKVEVVVPVPAGAYQLPEGYQMPTVPADFSNGLFANGSPQ